MENYNNRASDLEMGDSLVSPESNDFEEQVQAASTLDDLCKRLLKFKKISGSSKDYTPQELIEYIKVFEETGNKELLSIIPSTGKLRDKVSSLYELSHNLKDHIALSNESLDAVIETNLQMLNTEMLTLLNGESIGGNAGSIDVGVKRISCGGANGVIDKRIGIIKAFSNSVSHKNESDGENLFNFTYRVAYDIFGHNATGQRRIVGIILKDSHSNIALEDILKKTAEAWNATQPWSYNQSSDVKVTRPF